MEVSISENKVLWVDAEYNVWETLDKVSKDSAVNWERINNLPSIVQVASGSTHALFLDQNRCVWGRGNNRNGELGMGDLVPRPEPTKIENLPEIQAIWARHTSSYFLDIFNCLWCCGTNKIHFAQNINHLQQTPVQITVLP